MNRKIRVLVTDDDINWISSHIEMLYNICGKESLEIDRTYTGCEAIDMVEKNQPYDLILTDLEMESMINGMCAGAWFVKNIYNTEKCKNTKIIIISGSYDIKFIADEFAVSYIPKSQLINNPILLKYKLEEVELI